MGSMDVKALYKFTSGLYVVSTHDGDAVSACLINTGLQLTSTPLQVQVAVNKGNYTEGMIEKSGTFALTLVSETADMPYIGRFGFRTSRDFDKFDGIAVERTILGDPYTTEHAVAMLACEVVQKLDVGTHMLFVGEVKEAVSVADAAVIVVNCKSGLDTCTDILKTISKSVSKFNISRRYTIVFIFICC